MFKAIDLFCGCGGLSWGLKRAGIDVLAGIDTNSKYIQSFIKNFPDAIPFTNDIVSLPPEEVLKKLKLAKGELDLLVGGPPCQGFSKNTPKSKRAMLSDNNLLVKRFIEYCEAIFPKWIVMENVAEMRNGFDKYYTDIIESELTSLGYEVIHDVLNAADYGVPQRRRRAFFVARRDGVKPSMPLATHVKSNHIKVWDAISDLNYLNQGEGETKAIYKLPPENAYQKEMRQYSNNILYNHQPKKLTSIQNQRIQSLQPGQGIKDLPEDIRPKGGYSGAYGILTEDMIMPTITRWVFHPGSGRWGHPRIKRLITIREAARLHGFDDEFVFYGTYTDQAGQLGNSVPPLLAKAIVNNLIITS